MSDSHHKPWRLDYHIHLHYNDCASPEMTVANVVAFGRQRGIAVLGLVNHLHPETDLEIFRCSRTEMASTATDAGLLMQLGAEMDLIDQRGRTTYRDELPLLVDYLLLAMGHVHLPWVDVDLTLPPAYFLAREAESLLLALERTTVDIVAHPFIYPFLFRVAPGMLPGMRPHTIPHELQEALARVMCEKGVAFEFHCRDLLVRPERLGGDGFVCSYLKLMQFFREKGVKFVPGSDAHYPDQIGRAENAPSWAMNPLRPEHSPLSL